jgi:twitching motility protein PilI
MGSAISARHAGLRDFQQQLARRLQAAAAVRGTTQDCVAASTAARRWLFDLACAAEVIAVPTLAAVPFTLPWYLGLISHRGELAGVIDLDGLTGAPVTPWADTDRLLVLSPALPLRCAIRVSQLTGIVDRAALRAAPRDPVLPGWSPWSYDDDDGVRRAWVDLDALMRDPAFIDIGWR